MKAAAPAMRRATGQLVAQNELALSLASLPAKKGLLSRENTERLAVHTRVHVNVPEQARSTRRTGL